jgi:hypothetical protein
MFVDTLFHQFPDCRNVSADLVQTGAHQPHLLQPLVGNTPCHVHPSWPFRQQTKSEEARENQNAFHRPRCHRTIPFCWPLTPPSGTRNFHRIVAEQFSIRGMCSPDGATVFSFLKYGCDLHRAQGVVALIKDRCKRGLRPPVCRGRRGPVGEGRRDRGGPNSEGRMRGASGMPCTFVRSCRHFHPSPRIPSMSWNRQRSCGAFRSVDSGAKTDVAGSSRLGRPMPAQLRRRQAVPEPDLLRPTEPDKRPRCPHGRLTPQRPQHSSERRHCGAPVRRNQVRRYSCSVFALERNQGDLTVPGGPQGVHQLHTCDPSLIGQCSPRAERLRLVKIRPEPGARQSGAPPLVNKASINQRQTPPLSCHF